MPASHFEAAARTGPASLAVLDLLGDLDAAAEAALQAAYEQATAGNPPVVLLNFQRTEYINSTGIALIVSLLSRARNEDRAIAASGLSDHYREIFDLTRLSEYIKMFPDEAAALAAYNGGEERRAHV